MKRILLACTAIIGTMGIASAADLPSRKGPPVAPVYAPVFTWTGFYIGLNAGYVWGNGNLGVAPGTGTIWTGTGILSTYNTKPEGFLGGLQGGYNYQFGSFVVGAEADIQFSGASKSATWVGSIGGFNHSFYADQNLNYFGTVRARAGFAVDRALIYVTGGWAYAETGGSAYLTGPLGFWTTSGNSQKSGWTLGAGVEYAFTDNLTARLEYLYYDLGTTSATSNSVLVAGVLNSYGIKRDNTGNIVRAGVNWKFSTGSSVVAKY